MKAERLIAILGEIRQTAYGAESSPEMDKIYRLAGEALLDMIPDRRAAPKMPEGWIQLADELVRKLETASPPDILLKQITILGEMAAFLRELIAAGLSSEARSTGLPIRAETAKQEGHIKK